MTQRTALVRALKDTLKARGVTYARLAKRLGLSEASVKRIFARETFTLERLDAVCGALGIEISDLARIVEQEGATPARLTWEQEKELVADDRLLLVAVHALNHWSFDEIVAGYVLTKAECTRLLLRLDRLGILDLLPNNRIRVKVARNFAWLPDGPIQQYFRARLQNDFFRSRFDAPGELMVLVSGMLSHASNAVLQNHMRRLREEFAELHNRDLDLPLGERIGSSLLVAIRPWLPESFARLQKPPERAAPAKPLRGALSAHPKRAIPHSTRRGS